MMLPITAAKPIVIGRRRCHYYKYRSMSPRTDLAFRKA